MILTLPAIERQVSGREERHTYNPEFLLQNTHYEMGIDLLLKFLQIL